MTSQAFCDDLDLPFVEAPGESISGVAVQTLHLRPLNALRLPLMPGTSGWYIWGGDYSDHPDFYKPTHTHHLVESTPEIIKFLGLPPGYRILLAPGHEDVWFDESLLEPET
jgi:hypothetical protein